METEVEAEVVAEETPSVEVVAAPEATTEVTEASEEAPAAE